ncbi:SHOC2 [Symbiodinium sp. CCMP2456]|nr:SHOC2 [Symbiodinium sp. CCMP2456]
MTAYAHSLAEEATDPEKAVSHKLAELVLKGGAANLHPAAIASLLRCTERLLLPLAPPLLEAAADKLKMALHSGEDSLPPKRFGEALAALSELGADLEDVYETLSQRLADNILWWRREDGRTEDFALLFVNRWLFDLLGTRVGQGRAVFDLALAELLRDRLCKELPDAVRAPGDLARLIRTMDAMAMNRAHRPTLWRAFLATVARAAPHQDAAAAPQTWLPQLLELLRRSPFARNMALLETAAHMAGPVIQAAPGPELARMLQTLVGLREESFTKAVVQRHAAALEDRLLEPSTLGSARVATLAALANGGGTGVDMPWWRERILRPWGAELRRLVAALRHGPRRLGRGAYESELIQTQLSDVGSRWQPGVLGALGVPSPPRSFVLRGARAVLRQRRQTDASSPWALRALGFLSFRLAWTSGQAVEDGTLIFTAARQMKADDDVELMSVDIGFLDRRYRRHGDVERVALLRTLAALPPLERRSVTGTVDLYVDRAVCLSCLGILRQFHELLPKAELRLAVAGPPFFRHFASRQKGGVEREPCQDTSLREGDISAWDP